MADTRKTLVGEEEVVRRVVHLVNNTSLLEHLEDVGNSWTNLVGIWNNTDLVVSSGNYIRTTFPMPKDNLGPEVGRNIYDMHCGIGVEVVIDYVVNVNFADRMDDWTVFIYVEEVLDGNMHTWEGIRNLVSVSNKEEVGTTDVTYVLVRVSTWIVKVWTWIVTGNISEAMPVWKDLVGRDWILIAKVSVNEEEIDQDLV